MKRPFIQRSFSGSKMLALVPSLSTSNLSTRSSSVQAIMLSSNSVLRKQR